MLYSLRNPWLATLSVVFVSGATQSSNAAILRLQDLDVAGSQITIFDNGGLDANPEDGVVTFIGGVGNFNVNVSTGITKPAVSRSLIDLNSVDLTASQPGRLEIWFTETNFFAQNSVLGPGIQAFPATMLVGGTTEAARYKVESWVDDLNRQFGKGELVGEVGCDAPFFCGDTAFSRTFSTPVSLTNNSFYSISTRAEFFHNDPGDLSSFNVEVEVVPLPTAMPLMAGSLALLAGLRGWRRRRNPV